MPKITEQELKDVLRVVGEFAEGAGLSQIRSALAHKFSDRTLQRYLSLLVKVHKLVSEGRGRGTRYSVATVFRSEAPKAFVGTIEAQSEIPLSTDGEKICQLIRQPFHIRKPVGYNREFLYAYQPNQTFYLSQSLRQHLKKIGQSLENEKPAGTYIRQIFDRLLIDLSWNSSRLEGNTYSLLETERLLEIGETAIGKDAREAQMILNHKAAIELLIDETPEVGFNRYTILNFHALLSDNLLINPQACGRLRGIRVGIAGTVFQPLEVPQLIEDCFQRLIDVASTILDPFEQSFFAMVHIPYLQPFEDVNKRVSRLAANLPFVRANLSPLSFVDVPDRIYLDGTMGVYELNRVELLRDVFVWAYERSCARYAAVRQSLGEPDPFRTRYRKLMGELILHIVQNNLNKKSAVELIKRRAVNDLPQSDQNKFIEVVETELMTLHIGNIARYHLRPSEFSKWANEWKHR